MLLAFLGSGNSAHVLISQHIPAYEGSGDQAKATEDNQHALQKAFAA